MSYNATVLADSITPAGHRVTTLEVTMPRFILAELNTPRVFTRSGASSRAIPVERRILAIQSDLFVPEAFGKNKAGMQSEEALDEAANAAASATWESASRYAVTHAKHLAEIGAHKQHANRLIEPYAWHTAVITSTEWENWDALRVSKDAQPEMYKTAHMMREVRQASEPITCTYGQWHLPYVRGLEPETHFAAEFDMRVLGVDPVKVSIGRCAAVSYERQSSKTDMQKDEARCDKLSVDGHMAPLEHALRPMSESELRIFERDEYVWDSTYSSIYDGQFIKTGRKRYFLGNVEGWVQYRKMIPGEDVYQRRDE